MKINKNQVLEMINSVGELMVLDCANGIMMEKNNLDQNGKMEMCLD
jgi:hypothetical protein